MHWTDQLHRAVIAISDRVNRLDLDARLLAASGVKLDRALFPLLSRIAMNTNMTVADVANLAGRDHSTVSRQVVKLEQLGLLVRTADPNDQRAHHLALSKAGSEMLARIAKVRRKWMEDHFAGWNAADRKRLLELLDRMLTPPPEAAPPSGRKPRS